MSRFTLLLLYFLTSRDVDNFNKQLICLADKKIKELNKNMNAHLCFYRRPTGRRMSFPLADDAGSWFPSAATEVIA